MVEAQIFEISVFFSLLCSPSPFLPLGVSPMFYCSCSLFLSALSLVVLSSPPPPSGCWWCTVSGNQGNWPVAQSRGPSKSNGAIFSAACREGGEGVDMGRRGMRRETEMVILLWRRGPAFHKIVSRTFQCTALSTSVVWAWFMVRLGLCVSPGLELLWKQSTYGTFKGAMCKMWPEL